MREIVLTVVLILVLMAATGRSCPACDADLPDRDAEVRVFTSPLVSPLCSPLYFPVMGKSTEVE